MPKLSDLLPGIAEGVLSEVQGQRQRKQKMTDAIALIRAEQAAKRQGQPNLTQTVALLRGMGLQPARANISGTGETTFGFQTPRPIPGEAKTNAIIKQALSSKAQINEIYDRAETDLPAFSNIKGNYIPGGVEAITRGFGRKVAASSGFNENARAFLETQVANARQVIRGLGEVGVLTDKDVADAVKLLPASTDSDVVRKNKRASLNSLIDAKLSVYQTTRTPLETPGDDQAFIDQLEAQGYTVTPAN